MGLTTGLAKFGGGTLLIVLALAACRREPAPPQAAAADTSPQSRPPAIEVPPLDAGDFRGFHWGDPVEAVGAAEGRRSTVISKGYQYRTTVAGHPALVRFGRDQKDRLAGGIYLFPWPGERKSCGGTMTAGSECSLKSAEYALAVCEDVAALVSGQYHEMGAADKSASTRVSTAAELDSQLTLPDSGADVAYRHWSSKRVMVFQEFPRPRESGLGWRCEFTYIPPIGTSDNSVLLPTDDRETPVLPGA